MTEVIEQNSEYWQGKHVRVLVRAVRDGAADADYLFTEGQAAKVVLAFIDAFNADRQAIDLAHPAMTVCGDITCDGNPCSASPSPDGEEVDDLDRIEFQLREISAATVEYGPDGIPCGYGPPAHSAEEMADKAITCLALLDRHRTALSALPRRETVPTLTEEERERVEEIRARNAKDIETLRLSGHAPWDQDDCILAMSDITSLLNILTGK